jgi:hypothetical protein
MSSGQMPRKLNDREMSLTLKRIDGFVPLEQSEQVFMKHARRQLLSRAYVGLSWLGIAAVVFTFTYLGILLKRSSDMSYVVPRLSASLGLILVLIWLAATERISWKIWLVGIFVLFVMSSLIL